MYGQEVAICKFLSILTGGIGPKIAPTVVGEGWVYLLGRMDGWVDGWERPGDLSFSAAQPILEGLDTIKKRLMPPWMLNLLSGIMSINTWMGLEEEEGEEEGEEDDDDGESRYMSVSTTEAACVKRCWTDDVSSMGREGGKI